MRIQFLGVSLLSLFSLRASAASTAPPGGPTPIEQPRYLRSWFTALKAAKSSGTVARAIHYGDSTLAADGLARTVRTRLQARFGDAGPGFVPASFLPMWSVRADVAAHRFGDWKWRTILYGGGGGHYGLGGIVGILHAGDGVTLRAIDAVAQSRSLRHVEAWYQAGIGYGALKIQLDQGDPRSVDASASATEDRFWVRDAPESFERLRIAATGGSVPIYGLVLETGAPGATWETLSVSGVGSRSFTIYAGEGLGPQIAHRDPDLIVVMLGGNEAGYPVLRAGDGAGYRPIFRAAMDLIRAGAPDAACLIISPLDQGEVVQSSAEPTTPQAEPSPVQRRSKRGMPHLVAQQRAVAVDAGCAFWSALLHAPGSLRPPQRASCRVHCGREATAEGVCRNAAQGGLRAPLQKSAGAADRRSVEVGWRPTSEWSRTSGRRHQDAMGGEGSAVEWTRYRGMSTGDLVHLTGAGLEVIGNRLADALLDAYDKWDAGARHPP